ncbi:cytochrome d ubiquinol oxidase subunit II [Streptomyces sp. NBC_00572]|uniref:cytochrome d ubiquinol oxidase subunit II n=1 Tax=Streptomyces sp. NBC_00572 TaxID=2903664 RepID=UPI0022568B7E|nr:cytochrome d ubiquinol oxidase subunit II [Streptomyces sp. NBC_00572]MCX4983873.1 cytochrome d ubiquinol oxidase subunit II [Streptomyces sp. NBC_00572]
METLAIALLAFFAAGWFVLAGADIGTGMLMPWLGRSDHERRLVLASFAPFFLGNEVWLVATAGVLVGCFPALEGELLSGRLLVLVALLTGWIVRDAGLWSRGRGPGPRWRAACDAAVTCGSWTVALSWGWLLAALLTGRPYAPATGPTAVLTALAVAALFAAHGLGFATLRLTGLPYGRARRLVGRAGRPWQSFAFTAVLMAGLPLWAGTALPLAERAASPTTLGLLVPALLVVTPFLVAVQAWIWHTFRHRVTGPSYL